MDSYSPLLERRSGTDRRKASDDQTESLPPGADDVSNYDSATLSKVLEEFAQGAFRSTPTFQIMWPKVKG